MIPVTQDIKVSFLERTTARVATKKDVFVFLEDLSKTTRNTEFVQNVTSVAVATSLGGAGSEIEAAAQTFFAQDQRPDSFFVAAKSAAEAPASLVGNQLDSWANFIENAKVDEKYVDIKIKQVWEEGQAATVYTVPANVVMAIDTLGGGYAALSAFLNAQMTTKASFEVSQIDATDIQENVFRLVAKTVEAGSDKTINFFDNDVSAQTIPACLMSKSIHALSFDNFKVLFSDGAGGYDSIGLKVKSIADGTASENVIIDIDAVANYNDLIAAVNARLQASATPFVKGYVFGRYQTGENCVFFLTHSTNANIGYVENITGEADVHETSAGVFGLSEQTAPILQERVANVATENVPQSATLLQLTQLTGAHVYPGTDNLLTSASLISEFQKLLSKNSVRPNVITLSRNLTTNANKTTNYANMLNFVSGFNSSIGANGTVLLSLAVDEVQRTVTDDKGQNVTEYPLWEIVDTSRNICVNFVPNISIYLDVAIGAFVAGINWEASESSVRNTKGLTFKTPVTAINIGAELDDYLDKNEVNHYSLMDNGIAMYRNGRVCSSGDVPFIDLSAGINALTLDVRDALFNALIMESRGTLDSAGFSVAYAIIEKVCDKYVNNGFLSDTVIDETPYPAYEIRMPASYTAEQINKRQFPDIALLICGRNFVNQVTVNISNAY